MAKKKTIDVALSGVQRQWFAAARKAGAVRGKDLVVLSPYVTPPVINEIASRCGKNSLFLYTTFSAELFASGASNLDSLREVLRLGGRVLHVENLHAKVVMGDGVTTVGSQNVTKGGTKRKEANIIISDELIIEQIRAGIEPWLKNARPISLAMIADMEKRLPDLIKVYRDLMEASDAATDAVFQANFRRKEAAKKRAITIRKKADEKAIANAIKVADERTNRIPKFISAETRVAARRVYVSPKKHPGYWTLQADSTGNLLNWNMDINEVVTLDLRKRYLIFDEDTKRFAWVALNKTRLTQFGKGLFNARPTKFENLWLRIDRSFKWPPRGALEVPADRPIWNLEMIFRPSEETVKGCARFNFWLKHLEFIEVKDDTPWAKSKVLGDLLEQMDPLTEQMDKFLRDLLLSPFKYKLNRTGDKADEFLGDTDNVWREIRLHEFDENYFLTVRRA